MNSLEVESFSLTEFICNISRARIGNNKQLNLKQWVLHDLGIQQIIIRDNLLKEQDSCHAYVKPLLAQTIFTERR